MMGGAFRGGSLQRPSRLEPSFKARASRLSRGRRVEVSIADRTPLSRPARARRPEPTLHQLPRPSRSRIRPARIEPKPPATPASASTDSLRFLPTARPDRLRHGALTSTLLHIGLLLLSLVVLTGHGQPLAALDPNAVQVVFEPTSSAPGIEALPPETVADQTPAEQAAAAQPVNQPEPAPADAPQSASPSAEAVAMDNHQAPPAAAVADALPLPPPPPPRVPRALPLPLPPPPPPPQVLARAEAAGESHAARARQPALPRQEASSPVAHPIESAATHALPKVWAPSGAAQSRSAARTQATASANTVDPGWAAEVTDWLVSHRTYPTDARLRNIQGTVVVRFTVTADGRVIDLAVLQSSGNRRLDRAAEDMLRHARLPPFPPDMVQERQDVRVPISYSLE